MICQIKILFPSLPPPRRRLSSSSPFVLSLHLTYSARPDTKLLIIFSINLRELERLAYLPNIDS